MDHNHRAGTAYAIAAYLIWGLFPIYWKQLSAIPAAQLIGHRIVWSFVLLAAIVAITRQSRAVLDFGEWPCRSHVHSCCLAHRRELVCVCMGHHEWLHRGGQPWLLH